MTTVWLVVEQGGKFAIRECEGTDNGDGTWTVNVRGKGCRSKLLDIIPDAHVHRTLGAANARKSELEQ